MSVIDDPVFDAAKVSIMALIRANDCLSADDISSRFNSYDDGVDLLYEYFIKLRCNVPYIAQILALVDDTEMTDRGIYYNKSAGGTVENPKIIVTSNFTGINLNDGRQDAILEIIGAGAIGTITVDGNTKVSLLAITSGVTVDLLEIKAGSMVKGIGVLSCEGAVSTLTSIKNEGLIGKMSIDSDSVFGGVQCPAPVEI